MVQKAERVVSPRTRAGTRVAAPRAGRPVGNVTRGTTNPNRMRRVDRWLTGPQAWRLRGANDPLVVDLGYGASPATAVELFERLSAIRADVRVVGIEIEPERVRQARALERPGFSFELGGFELPVAGPPGAGAGLQCAAAVRGSRRPAIWRRAGPLGPGRPVHRRHLRRNGRRVTWVALDAERPLSLGLSMRFGSFRCLGRRRAAAESAHPPERAGREDYCFLQAMDKAWLEAAPLASFGNRQRWTAMCRALRDGGWPVQDGPSRWRLVS